MRYTLGMDVGTSGTKAALFDETGRRAAAVTVDYPLYQPRNGWAEQSPEPGTTPRRRSERESSETAGLSQR